MLALSACSTVVDYASQPNDVLFAEGMGYMDEKNYKKAADMFRLIILNADNPANAQAAQKMLGDAYFLAAMYLDAIAAYEIHYEMYRQSPHMPYIIYMLGVAYSNISTSGGRDTSYAQKAIEYFDELQIRFPAEYEQFAAANHRAVMVEKLAAYELRVAKYYIRINQYEPAMTRLVGIINNYTDSEILEEAYITLIESAIDVPDYHNIAITALDDLKRLYPDNGDIDDLQEEIDELNQEANETN
jgi:outer membrane protein assembly factor BamD